MGRRPRPRGGPAPAGPGPLRRRTAARLGGPRAGRGAAVGRVGRTHIAPGRGARRTGGGGAGGGGPRRRRRGRGDPRPGAGRGGRRGRAALTVARTVAVGTVGVGA